VKTEELLPQKQYDRRGESSALRRVIATGERRLERLDEVIDERMCSDKALPCYQAERIFVRAAIVAIGWHLAVLDDETNPLLVLQDLLSELKQLGLPGHDQNHDRLNRLVTKARRILADFDIVVDA
jgi:hypothetical protein